MAVSLTACGAEHFDQTNAEGDAASYDAMYPYYAEFCALSEIEKKPGFGADIRGQIGGHSVFYLNGACRDPDSDYPVLQVCAPTGNPRTDGVGISMNSHFSNAKWVAIPGRAFFFSGGLRRDQALTRADYVRVQAEAKRLGLYRDVTFHDDVFEDKPADMSRDDYKYEVSVATDYAISFGRGRYCARVPVNRAQMARMVTFLNAQNAPYRSGDQVFDWKLFQDNCIHLAHNALSAAGIWPVWPTDMPLLFAILDFPVPKNEFVNLVRRTNDPTTLDPLALFQDPDTRRAVLTFGRLPWGPGALTEVAPPQEPNEIYDTDVKLAFYEDPILQLYQHRFDAIFDKPRYFETEQNLQHFAALYRQMGAERQPLATLLAKASFNSAAERQQFSEFYARLYSYVDHERETVAANLSQMNVASRSGGALVVLSQTDPQ